MSASIPRKKGWGGARFDDRLDAQCGNHRRFVSRLRFRLSPHCLYKTIDDFSGCLYPQLDTVSRPPMRETLKYRNFQNNQYPS